MKSPIWTTSRGTKVKIRDMEDAHLVNTILMLRRRAQAQIHELTPPCFQGEMAQYYADQEYDALMEMDEDEAAQSCFEIYEDLMDECERRKLTLP